MLNRHTIPLSLLLTDLIAFNLAPVLAGLSLYLATGKLYDFIPSDEIGSRLACYLLLSVLCTSWFATNLKLYSERQPFLFELKDTLRILLIYAVFDLAIIAFSKWQLSRYLWVLTWSYMLLLMPLLRHVTRKVWQYFHVWKVPAVLIGSEENALEAYQALSREKGLGYDFIACIPNPKTLGACHGLPALTTEKAVFDMPGYKNFHYFIATEHGEEQLRKHWIKILTSKRCHHIAIIPTTRGLPLNNLQARFLFSHEIMILNLGSALTKPTSRIIKRSFDILVSTLLLILLSPVFIALSYLIRKDGGKAVYGHERVGQGGKKFKCLKFRSMVSNSQEVLAHLLATDAAARAEWEQDFKLKNDPRITKIGHFLRRSSLDELPQLWNVLKGEMSLVGPRPVVEEEVLRYRENKDYYLLAKPGMTGLWQVSGRNDVDYDKRVYFDAWYVKNWSLWHDICILYKTVAVVLKRDGAY
ncbi:undecaprenyl-phosphate galactose phosphotransferase WbaP [Alcaligenes faecalis]|uniref:undecaprenyl-phosphate galactose phosphotransferase WbaP n=1 Tax=Alcaligenes faecalis TaxID=511 RepID=UPI002AA7D27A|nr:undecaprenyl-phosphate galactose phosphotransferase WbaP [Alcaligenes faecalis]